MSSPSTPAIRLHLSLRTAVMLLIQLAAFCGLSACSWPGPPLAQVPTATLTLRTADLASQGDAGGLYRGIERAYSNIGHPNLLSIGATWTF